MTWRFNEVDGFSEIMRKSRKPRINEQKKRIIVKKTASEDF
jgi:hypothetical protein